MQAPSPDPILIVDDNPTNLLVLTQTLEELNYPITMANSGEEALELAQNQPPSLVLLDIMMQKMICPLSLNRH